MAAEWGSRPAGGGGGGGLVDSVNGIDPVAGDVSLTATDIPSDGPSNVQTDLDLLKPITSQAQLESRYPNVAGVHTIDQATEFALLPGQARIDLDPGRTIVAVYPGSVFSPGGVVPIHGDAPGPLLSGECPCSNLEIRNAHASGSDILFESLFGRNYVVENLQLVGESPGGLANVLSVIPLERLSIAAPSPTAIGLSLDGVIGAVLFTSGAAASAGGSPYTAFTVEPTCIVASALGFDTCTFFASITGDAFLKLDPAASYPTSPPPTTVFGLRVTGTLTTGPGDLFAAGSLDETDIRVYSGYNPNGASSQFLGDALLDVEGGAAMSLSHAAFPAGTLLVTPSDNGALASLVLQDVSQRHALIIESTSPPYRYRLQYKGANNALTATDRWSAQINRSGGSAAQVEGYIQRRAAIGSGSAKQLTPDLGPAGPAPDGTYSIVINGTPFDEISVAQTKATVVVNLRATIDGGAEPVFTAQSDAAEAFVIDSTNGAVFTFSSSGPATIDLWGTLSESKGVVGATTTTPRLILGEAPTNLSVGDEVRVVMSSTVPATDTEITFLTLQQRGTQ